MLSTVILSQVGGLIPLTKGSEKKSTWYIVERNSVFLPFSVLRLLFSSFSVHTSAVQVKNQGVRLHTEHQSASEVGCPCEEDG